jgi:hypothetical protein
LKKQQEVIKKLDDQSSLRTDRRMEMFGSLMRGSLKSVDGSKSLSKQVNEAKNAVKELHKNRCLACGSDYRLSAAHLVAGHPKNNYDAFSMLNGYKDDYNFTSVRNFIPLCGSSGENHTCHNEFDKHFMAFVPDPFYRGNYTIQCLREEFSKYRDLNGKNVTLDLRAEIPYTRALAWHARKCYLHSSTKTSDEIWNLIQRCDLSEGAESVAREGLSTGDGGASSSL